MRTNMEEKELARFGGGSA